MMSSSPRMNHDNLGGLLNRFAQIAAAGTDAKDLTDWLLKRMVTLTGWPVAYALLVDAHSSVSMWHSLRSNVGKFNAYTIMAESIAMRPPTGLMYRAMVTKQPAWVSDLSISQHYPRSGAAISVGLRGVFAIPVVRNDRVVAILQFLSDDPIEPTAEFVDAATIVGFVLGTAFDRIQLREEDTDRPSRSHSIHSPQTSAFVRLDADGRIIEWSAAAERLFGWRRSEVLQRKAAAFTLAPEWWDRHREVLEKIRTVETPELEFDRRHVSLVRRDGSPFLAEVSQWVLGAYDDVTYGLFFRDIREEDERARGKRIDTVTGLPNRAELVDALHEHLGRHQDDGQQPGALILISLHNFKRSDTVDTEKPLAELALQRIADRLRRVVDPENMVARIAGDEFGILLRQAPNAAGLASLLRRLQGAVRQPFTINHATLAFRSHAGAAYPEPSTDVQTWWGAADTALVRARQDAQGGFEIDSDIPIYRPYSLSGQLRRREALEVAIKSQQFELHYQPIVRTDTRKIAGAEALLRWRHPEFGLLHPGDFLDLAEKSGLIIPVGAWVFRTAAEQISRWFDRGISDIALSINLSAEQLSDPNLLDLARQAIKMGGQALHSCPLVIEVTESALMTDPEMAATRLSQLRQLGLHTAIDDFGTGYSSLAYLKWFELDYLKIDMSFVQALTDSLTDQAIVRTSVNLAHDLGLEVVAEGAETAEQIALVHSFGAEYVQGFAVGRPMPAADMTQLLLSHTG